MNSVLILTFCLGFSVGAIYTYIVYQIVEKKGRKKKGK